MSEVPIEKVFLMIIQDLWNDVELGTVYRMVPSVYETLNADINAH